TDQTQIGESWEISAVPGHVSVVDRGPLAGQSLTELIDTYGADLVGRHIYERYGSAFPLLIKLIDAKAYLSVQVHPDDDLAARRHNGSLGKTEMWYSILPAEGAYLYAGFSRRLDADSFRSAVADNSIIDSLRRHDTRPGDVFFLPAGRIHSIGRGNFVLEIQEASDITYRIYDYDRRDAQGNPRQLHIEESVGAIDFNDIA
ncbi:type I phosphomannose isomerase catalytic subunit, partial [Paramuribaculum intestinale]|uniref:type I phosphomannose isomerase catalytic subunit n=1 Tax=Paramuribaculum intestinale TaxID=2094151 RepID=UPI0025B702B2